MYKTMTRNFPVFPPENLGFENGRISKSFFEAIGRLQVVKGIKKTIFLACGVREASRTQSCRMSISYWS